MLCKKLVVIGLLLVFASSTLAGSVQPMETIKGPVDGIIEILEDPQYQDEAMKDRQRDQLWQTVKQLFDFSIMSKLTLARNWRKLSAAEKEEFTQVFSDFLANIYISKIQGEFSSERVIYVDQKIISDKKAVVKTKIVRDSVEIPMDYSLRKSKAVWRAYDVKIETFSLVSTYRSQFKEFLAKKTPAQLIAQLKEKAAEQKEEGTETK